MAFISTLHIGSITYFCNKLLGYTHVYSCNIVCMDIYVCGYIMYIYVFNMHWFVPNYCGLQIRNDQVHFKKPEWQKVFSCENVSLAIHGLGVL